MPSQVRSHGGVGLLRFLHVVLKTLGSLGKACPRQRDDFQAGRAWWKFFDSDLSQMQFVTRVYQELPAQYGLHPIPAIFAETEVVTLQCRLWLCFSPSSAQHVQVQAAWIV